MEPVTEATKAAEPEKVEEDKPEDEKKDEKKDEMKCRCKV